MDIDKEKINKAKYLKYKLKYVALKKQHISEGGGGGTSSTVKEKFYADAMDAYLKRDLLKNPHFKESYNTIRDKNILKTIEQKSSKHKNIADAIAEVLKEKKLENLQDYLTSSFNEYKSLPKK
jgi:hypothetical protein